jgi:hypothetical protein
VDEKLLHLAHIGAAAAVEVVEAGGAPALQRAVHARARDAEIGFQRAHGPILVVPGEFEQHDYVLAVEHRISVDVVLRPETRDA